MKTFEVYHAKAMPFLYGKSPDEIAAIVDFPADYDHVATVQCESHEETFILTNHIDKKWWENPGVTLRKAGGARSTSVGDVVVSGTQRWVVLPFGWQELEQTS
jgi:hypothetical protein